MAPSIEEMLGLTSRTPSQRLAKELVEEHHRLIKELADIRRKTTTQNEVARRMGVDQSTIARIESGSRDIHLSTLRRYAHAVRAHITHTIRPMETTTFAGEGGALTDLHAWRLDAKRDRILPTAKTPA